MNLNTCYKVGTKRGTRSFTFWILWMVCELLGTPLATFFIVTMMISMIIYHHSHIFYNSNDMIHYPCN